MESFTPKKGQLVAGCKCEPCGSLLSCWSQCVYQEPGPHGGHRVLDAASDIPRLVDRVLPIEQAFPWLEGVFAEPGND